MRHLQTISDKYSKTGLVLLGVNFSDSKEVAQEELRRQGVTFTNILDTSSAAQKVEMQDYRVSAVPANYIIDRQGRIVDGWYGNDKTFARAMRAIKQAGIPDARPLDASEKVAK